jgi:hypothetical protein
MYARPPSSSASWRRRCRGCLPRLAGADRRTDPPPRARPPSPRPPPVGRRDRRSRGGQGVRRVAVLQPAHQRQQQRACKQRDDDRQHNDPQVHQRIDDYGACRGDRQEPPARGRSGPIPGRQCLVIRTAPPNRTVAPRLNPLRSRLGLRHAAGLPPDPRRAPSRGFASFGHETAFDRGHQVVCRDVGHVVERCGARSSLRYALPTGVVPNMRVRRRTS